MGQRRLACYRRTPYTGVIGAFHERENKKAATAAFSF
jgi:hypothetical protein